MCTLFTRANIEGNSGLKLQLLILILIFFQGQASSYLITVLIDIQHYPLSTLSHCQNVS